MNDGMEVRYARSRIITVPNGVKAVAVPVSGFVEPDRIAEFADALMVRDDAGELFTCWEYVPAYDMGEFGMSIPKLVFTKGEQK